MVALPSRKFDGKMETITSGTPNTSFSPDLKAKSHGVLDIYQDAVQL